jgi:hypothetical protein
MIPGCKVCGAQAVVLFPGDAAPRAPAYRGVRKIDDDVKREPVEGFALCLPHARRRGWPNLPVEVRGRSKSRGVHQQ